MKFILNLILMFRLMFGHYYKMNYSSYTRRIARIYCVLIFAYNTAFFVYLVIKNYFTSVLYAGLFFSFSLYSDSTTNMLLSFTTGEKHIIQFSKNNFEASFENAVPWDSYMAYILLLILLIGRFYEFLTLGSFAYGSVAFRLYTLPFYTSCTAYLSSVYVTESYRRFVYCLRNTIQKDLKQNASDEHKNNNLKHFARVYVALTKSFSDTFKYERFRVALGLMYCWMKIIGHIIYHIQYDTWDPRELPWDFDVILYVAVTCLPFIIMEFAANDLEEIKSTLVNQLLTYKDVKYRLLLHDTLQYIDLCMYKYTMWFNCPVNVTTLLKTLNLCITFAIVILQFFY